MKDISTYQLLRLIRNKRKGLCNEKESHFFRTQLAIKERAESTSGGSKPSKNNFTR